MIQHKLGCRELSWEAATERMMDAAELGPNDWPKTASKVAEATLFSAYNTALGELRTSLHNAPASCIALHCPRLC